MFITRNAWCNCSRVYLHRTCATEYMWGRGTGGWGAFMAVWRLGNSCQRFFCTHTRTHIDTQHNKAAAPSSSAHHFLLRSARLLPLSTYSIVLHAPVDSSCRASTFHIITTSDVCGPEARRLAEPPPTLGLLRANERPALGSRGDKTVDSKGTPSAG